MKPSSNLGRGQRLAWLLIILSGALGAFAFLFNLVASPHYGWLLHRWAFFFGAAVTVLALGTYFADNRARVFAVIVLVLLAVSAVDPLRRIFFYGSWWDA